MVRPDYAGTGLLNLIASLIEARGGEARHPTLARLLPSEILAARNVLLLIVDGLGDLYLARHGAGGELERRRRGAFMMSERFTINDWTPGEPRHLHIGNHGGASAEEMMVPLVVAAT
jgi:hypothetical protein